MGFCSDPHAFFSIWTGSSSEPTQHTPAHVMLETLQRFKRLLDEAAALTPPRSGFPPPSAGPEDVVRRPALFLLAPVIAATVRLGSRRPRVQRARPGPLRQRPPMAPHRCDPSAAGPGARRRCSLDATCTTAAAPALTLLICVSACSRAGDLDRFLSGRQCARTDHPDRHHHHVAHAQRARRRRCHRRADCNAGRAHRSCQRDAGHQRR